MIRLIHMILSVLDTVLGAAFVLAVIASLLVLAALPGCAASEALNGWLDRTAGVNRNSPEDEAAAEAAKQAKKVYQEVCDADPRTQTHYVIEDGQFATVRCGELTGVGSIMPTAARIGIAVGIMTARQINWQNCLASGRTVAQCTPAPAPTPEK